MQPYVKIKELSHATNITKSVEFVEFLASRPDLNK